MAAPTNFEVVLTSDSGSLEEKVTAKQGTSPVDVKGLKKKALKKEYKDQMKDSARYSQTHMADSDHPTLILTRSHIDTVDFYYKEPFVIFTTRDPEIDGDPDAPIGPFIDSGNNQVTYRNAAKQSGTPPPEKLYRAGPYTLAEDSHKQKFYKFSVITDGGLYLDPDIVCEL